MKILLENCQTTNGIQNVLIKDGIIAYIGEDTPDFDRRVDLTGLFVIPGMIDPHVHVRDLRQADKEDWTSMSNAALRGGVTTVFDMPNTNPPTINLDFLNQKRIVAKAAKVHYRFNIAATAYNLPDVVEILETKPADVAALKLFLAGSNSNEFVGDEEVIKRIFDISLRYDLPVIIHTEWQACIDKYASTISFPTVKNHNYLRNRECSIRGTELVIKLATETGNTIYIAHTSTAEEMDIIKANKGKCRLFCETSPHHLLINEEILDKVGNFGKVNPPLRTKKDNERILQGIIEGTVDTIGSDHAPHRLHEKLRPYTEAPSGFPGLETTLPLLLNEVNKGSFSMKKLVELTAGNAAKIFKVTKRGALKVGYHADLTIIDMQKKWTIESADFATKAKYSPYEGMTGKGSIIQHVGY